MSQQEEFITKLTQIAVVQIAEDVGSDGIRQSALNTLSEVVQRFIQEIGSTAAAFANANGRTECNYFDIESSLNEIGFEIKDLVQFENGSYPLQTPIDIQSLEISNNKKNKNKHNNNNNIYDGIQIDELEESIANNKFTKNGTVIFDSQKDILEILDRPSRSHSNYKNKRKLKGEKGVKSKGGRRMKHIPEFCPDYPNNLLYKHTPIYYKPLAHHYQDDGDGNNIIDQTKQEQIEQKKQDNFEKTRKCVINNSEIFSNHNDTDKDNKNNNNNKNKKRKLSGLNELLLKQARPNKRQKLNGNHNGKNKKKKINDKMENDDDDSEHEIIENDVPRKYG